VRSHEFPPPKEAEASLQRRSEAEARGGYPANKVRAKAQEKTHEKSDQLIVPRKPVTPVEGRGRRRKRSNGQNIERTGGAEEMGNAYERIAQNAHNHGKLQTLMHYVNKENLAAEHQQQEKWKAKGIDGESKETYGAELEKNLENLLERMKRFSYRPQAVRRVYIPKDGSEKKRPLGIPAYEDKLVQGVMRKVLDEIYEGKFKEYSYGFREGKSCHQAIQEVDRIIMTRKINYVVDADIKGFFDNVDHEWLMKFLRHDIGDENFLRYIVRFLKAGIMEDMQYRESEKGTPQGGLISPVLANVYLHYVLDLWFEKKVKKESQGEAYMVRYADDFICMFEREEDAKGFYEALKERLAKFGLELAEEKSRIMRFGRNAQQGRKGEESGMFDFLGFTHSNGKTRMGGYTVVRRTSQKKLKIKRKKLKEWLESYMHVDVKETVKELNKKLQGHYQYYGISGNYKGIQKFYRYAELMYWKVLKRRSQKSRMTWARYEALTKENPMAKPRICYQMW
jgi:group II intron reverse transcriptase/maturase